MNLIFDIDGTICNNRKHIAENIQEEIKSLYNKHNVVFASFNDKFNLNKHSKDNLFDITPNHNNKYIALKDCDLNMQESICLGNDHNDFMMLDNAYISVFVGGENTYNDADIYTDFDGVHNVIRKLKSTGVL